MALISVLYILHTIALPGQRAHRPIELPVLTGWVGIVWSM